MTFERNNTRKVTKNRHFTHLNKHGSIILRFHAAGWHPVRYFGKYISFYKIPQTFFKSFQSRIKPRILDPAILRTSHDEILKKSAKLSSCNMQGGSLKACRVLPLAYFVSSREPIANFLRWIFLQFSFASDDFFWNFAIFTFY